MTAPLLVLAWGNPSRGDDALGPLFAEALRPQAGDGAEFIEDFQLQVEHALDLVGRQRVLFVDASLTCAVPFEARALKPARDASFTTHAMSPTAVMQVYRDLQGSEPPPCMLLSIRGERFELGEPLGNTAAAHLAAALGWGRRWLAAGLDETQSAGG